MPKAHRPLSPAQVEHQRAAQDRKQLWDRLWLALIIAVFLGLIGFNIYIQIIHHP